MTSLVELNTTGLYDAVSELSDLATQYRDGIDANRRMPDEIIEAMHRTGLARSSQPRVYGGAELNFPNQLALVTELAKTCASTSWTIGVYISHNWNLALFGKAAQDDVWAQNPTAVACTSAVGGPGPTLTNDGYHFTEGTWTFLSGVHHADWIIVNAAPVDVSGRPQELTSFLVPRGEFRIVDDWDTIALRGTGTCSITLENVFVPHHRTLTFSSQLHGATPGSRMYSSPMYSTPLEAIWPAYLGAPAVGAAYGALEQWSARTAKRVNAYTREALGGDRSYQSAAGYAAARIDAAHSLLLANARRCEDTVSAGGDRTELRVRNRRDFALAIKMCTDVSDDLFARSGASSLNRHSQFQRKWLDIHGVSQHAMFEFDRSMSGWGRRELGVSSGDEF